MLGHGAALNLVVAVVPIWDRRLSMRQETRDPCTSNASRKEPARWFEVVYLPKERAMHDRDWRKYKKPTFVFKPF